MFNNPYLSLLRTAWTYARHEKQEFVAIYSLFVLSSITNAFIPWLFGWYIGQLQLPGANVVRLTIIYAAAYFGQMLLEWAFHGPARVMERRLAFNLSRNFLQEMFHQTLHLPVSWHKDHHSGSTINRIRKAYEALKNFFQNGFMYMYTLSKFVFSFGAMLYFSPLFGVLCTLLGAVTIWIILQFDRPFIRAVDETNEHEHVVSSTLFDSLSNIITVITLRLEQRIQKSLSEKIVAVFAPFMRQVKINEWKWFVASIMVALIYLVMAGGYVYQHYIPGQVFLIGGLVTLLGYVNQFTSVFHDVAYQYTEIVQYNTDVQTARSIGQAYDAYEHPQSAQLPQQWKHIDIDQLTFTHSRTEPSQNADLHKVHLQLARGRRIALIGASGSGKSTLLAVLRGLYTAETSTTVIVDAHQSSSLLAISDTVTLFPQEPEIFENTIAYNITLGLPCDMPTIEEVSRLARFDEVVRQLPRSFDTNIQEKGVNLSGGQRQRLALARGILAARSSEIVLLDEPTSSVDPTTELAIYKELMQEFSEKAVVSTLHRLHLLPLFDYVYIMAQGRIADEGTFTELLRRSEVFKKMWAHQQELLQHETDV